MDGDRDRDPLWSTGLSSQGPNEEQKEGEYEGSKDHEGCVHPLNTGLNSLGPNEKQMEGEREQGRQDQREPSSDDGWR